MIHVHALNGCAPAPLAHYLKALGVLRLVAEQADSEARAWWEGERFRLATRLDRSELQRFFLEGYEPTPLVAPWNKGSGFFYADDPALAPLEKSIAPRFGGARNGIAAARMLLAELAEADESVRCIKAEAKTKGMTKAARQQIRDSPEYKARLADAERRFKVLKAQFIPRCRSAWRGRHREWMDAAMVLDDSGNPRFPALLGTGGNDGRLDFTNNFMQRLGDVFDVTDPMGKAKPRAASWFDGALWGEPTAGCQAGSSVGQYLPGMAGGANSTNGPSGDSLLNPADFLLMLEGAVLFVAHAARRMDTQETSRAAAPFVVGAQGAGYASAADSDDSARGEQWMPLWLQPMTLAETKRLLAEGRAQIGARAARGPLDLARAVARLGSARGIAAFQRYGYIERNGQSNLAVPLGRFRVPDFASPRLACLDDLDVWLNRLRRQARDARAPARLQLVERRLADGLFAVAQHPDEPSRWQAVLLAIADVESVLRTGGGFAAGPVPRLRPEWVGAADDGSPEFRLAVAAALQVAGLERKGEREDSVRRHWLPLDPKRAGRFATTGSAGQTRLQSNPDVVISGRSGVADAIALVSRRLTEAGQRGERHLPLAPARRASAHPSDLARFLSGEVNVDRTMQLARALMALDSRRWTARSCPTTAARGDALPDDAWLAIRLALLPWPLPDGRRIGADPAIVRRLDAGDAGAAVELALRRLRAAGINAAVRVAVATPDSARLWAAALAFPVSRRTAAFFADRLDPNAIDQGELA